MQTSIGRTGRFHGMLREHTSSRMHPHKHWMGSVADTFWRGILRGLSAAGYAIFGLVWFAGSLVLQICLAAAGVVAILLMGILPVVAMAATIQGAEVILKALGLA